MKKIPVGQTIARAYGFAFRDFVKILGVMWLPMAVMWLPGIFIQQRMLALQAQMGPGNLNVFREMGLFLVPFYLVMFFLIFMQVIGIAKLALGIKKKPDWIFFSAGKPVWRLIGTCLLLIVAMIVGWLAMLLGGFLTGFVAGLLNKAVNNTGVHWAVAAVAIVILAALWCAYIYAFFRLAFLVVPVIAAEEQGFALARSWTLGLGNFWRIFLIALAVVLPFLVLEFVFLFGFMFRGIPFPANPKDPAQSMAFQIAMNARMLEMIQGMYHYWYLTFPLFIVVIVLFYGAYVSAPCFAYQALIEGKASDPVAAD